MRVRSIKIPDELDDIVELLASELGISKSEFIRYAIIHFLLTHYRGRVFKVNNAEIAVEDDKIRIQQLTLDSSNVYLTPYIFSRYNVAPKNLRVKVVKKREQCEQKRDDVKIIKLYPYGFTPGRLIV